MDTGTQATIPNRSEGERRPVSRFTSLKALYRTYLWRSVALGVVTALIASFVIRNQPERYSAHSTIEVSQEFLAEQRISLPGQQNDLAALVATHVTQIDGTAFLGDFWDQLSDMAKDKIVKPYETNREDGPDPVEILKDSIAVRRLGESLFVEIEVEHPFSYVSKYLADELARQYATYAQNQFLGRNQIELSRLESLAKKQRQSLQSAERELQDYRKEAQINLIEAGDPVLANRIRQINSAYLDAKMKRVQLESTLEEIASARARGLETVLSIDPLKAQDEIMRLGREAEQLQRDLDELSLTYQKRHPKLSDTINAITANRRSLEIEIDKYTNSIQYEFGIAKKLENELSQELEALESETLEASSKQVQYDIIKSNVTAQRAAYDEILRRLSVVQLAARNPITPIRLADMALLPQEPSYPTPFHTVGIPFLVFIGTVISVPLCYLTSNKSFESWNTIETELGARILGTIPQITRTPGAIKYSRLIRWKKRDLPTLDFEKVRSVPARESMSALASQILIGPVHRGSQVFMVTSHGENEGKSMTVFNIAKEFAKAGKRTLVIDADLRRDVLYKAFEKSGIISPAEGLCLADWFTTKSFSNNNANLALCRSNTIPDLDFIPGGDGGQISAKLILSQGFQQLISQFRRQYDIILLDTPPAGSYSDALLMTSVADELLYLIRDKSVDRIGIRKTLRTLRSGHANIAGIVLNGLNRRQLQLIGSYYVNDQRNRKQSSANVA